MFLNEFIGSVLFTLDGHLFLENKNYIYPTDLPSYEFLPAKDTHRVLRLMFDILYIGRHPDVRHWSRTPVSRVIGMLEVPHCYICRAQARLYP